MTTAKDPNKSKSGTALAPGGITEQEMNVLLGMGEVKKLDRGAMLAYADNEIFLVMEGALRLMKAVGGVNLHLASLKAGDWGGSLAGAAARAETTAAIAEEPARVLLISNPDSGAAPASVLLKVYRRMIADGEKQVVSLAHGISVQQQKSRYLSAYAHQLRSRANAEAIGSGIMRGVIAKIPRLPAYITQLLALLQDRDADAKEVVECARQDPSLVTEILKIVNSAAFGFDREITDVRQAVMLLGFNKVSQIVVGLGVAGTMPNSRDFRELLNRSIAVSHMAYEIAKLCPRARPSLASTVGLLHEVGLSVLLLMNKEFPKMAPFFNFCDQALVGAELLKHWGLPESLWLAIANQNLPEYAPPEMLPETCRESVAALHLALLCDRYLGGAEEQEVERGFFRDYQKFLECPEETVAALVAKRIVPTLRKQGENRIFTA